MPPPERAGRRTTRRRTFTTGWAVVRFRLDRSYPIPIWPDRQMGALYIPTTAGGTLDLHAITISSGSRRRVRLFYKTGEIGNPPTANEIAHGTHALGGFQRSFIYNVPRGRMGWFFIVVEGTARVRVGNTFIQDHSTSTVPWNTWYWPGALAKKPHLYDKAGVTRRGRRRSGSPYSDTPSEDGPLAKYDTYVGTGALRSCSYSHSCRDKTPTCQTSSVECEWAQMGKGIRADSVGGHCDATAWMGFEETRPVGPVTRINSAGTSLTLSEHDRIGLCTSRYWIGVNLHNSGNFSYDNTSHVLFSYGGTNLTANWFHVKLHESIVDNNRGIQVHDSRNWNYGVFRFRSQFRGFGTSDEDVKKVRVVTRMYYVDWGTVSSTQYRKWHGGPERYVWTEYNLEYRSNGTIRSQLGPWAKYSNKRGSIGRKRIQFVFWRKKTAQPINQKVESSVLESLYQ